MNGTSATQTVDVSVAGAGSLRLVLDQGASADWDHADWALARVDCGSGGSDTTPPTITGQAPTNGATGVAVAISPLATFSEAMNASTITSSTFTLVKQGTTTPLAASVSYASQVATLDPTADLLPATTYTATVKGGPSGVKDLAGNALAADASWTFTTGASGGPQPPPSGTSYLSDLTWTSMSNHCGPIEKDKSNGNCGAGDGGTLSINGVTFAKGLGAHAPSDVSYFLGGACTRFKASIGIDDEVPTSNGSVVFQVYADSTLVYTSPSLNGTSATQTVDVWVAGAELAPARARPGCQRRLGSRRLGARAGGLHLATRLGTTRPAALRTAPRSAPGHSPRTSRTRGTEDRLPPGASARSRPRSAGR